MVFFSSIDARASTLWDDPSPIREEIFGIERLRQHAASLASAQAITASKTGVIELHRRLGENAVVLLAAYRASAAELDQDRDVVPAAEWLLDNYHLVEAQISEIRTDLPPAYYCQLPKLADGPFKGYPRVFGVAWAFVAHTDSNFDTVALEQFLAAYQEVQPLTIGELWAVAITLRIVLIENLRRLTDQIMSGLRQRDKAEALAKGFRDPNKSRAELDGLLETIASKPLSERFAAELAKLLRDEDLPNRSALPWLEQRLAAQGTSIDQVVRHAQQRQGASNVSVRNIITSMRQISTIDWGDFVESVSLVDTILAARGVFARMDFASRNAYRTAVEQLARGCASTEVEVALHAVRLSSDAVHGPQNEPGHYLIGGGRIELESALGCHRTFGMQIADRVRSLGLGGYAAMLVLAVSLLLGTALTSLDVEPTLMLVAFAVFALLPFGEAARALVNRALGTVLQPQALPSIDLSGGVPSEGRTLVAIPSLLTGEDDVLDQVEQLEVHFLSGTSGDLSFVLLLDGVDAPTETLDSDVVGLNAAAAAIEELNERHGPGPAGKRFWLLYRRRIYNPQEGCWMGWERKRGKLHEMNRLLRGARNTSFVAVAGQQPSLPDNVRYVVTLDADTQMPRDAASKLVGKMMHPLNTPVLDPAIQQVVSGHAILQPRVTPSLNHAGEGSLYRAITSGPGGIDPYAGAISDLYQDMFGEGSFTGKGIYDVDAFEAAMAGRVPENTLLSHDLFEGVFARSALVTDIEVIEDFPSRYDVAVRREHRWMRGDWQLLPWISGLRSGPSGVPILGRWKMIDNLRRTLIAPCAVLALGVACLLPPLQAFTAAFWIATVLALPNFLSTFATAFARRPQVPLRHHASVMVDDLSLAAVRASFDFATLPDRAWRAGDAIVRTSFRLLTRRHLLEWTTAAQSARRPRRSIGGSYRDMAGGVLIALLFVGMLATWLPFGSSLALALGLLWVTAPVLAWAASLPPQAARVHALEPDDAVVLRRIARRTWRFFETFVTPLDHFLPPDNFQETPKPVIAHRTSPTNMGLYLLSTVVARDFGWVGTVDAVDRVEASLSVMEGLPRYRGHFFNWYDTRDLRVLDPAYISSVDSGNLAGHLIALANALELWAEDLTPPTARDAIGDALSLAHTAAGGLGQSKRRLLGELDAIAERLAGEANPDEIADMANASRAALPAVTQPDWLEPVIDLHFWLGAISTTIASHDRDIEALTVRSDQLRRRLRVLAQRARDMAMAMDFAFLLDPDRQLLSIGYVIADNSLDANCYDLLASEARLASLFAIAKGDIATRHWFHLGRTATPIARASALISWSGSMFEYLMPSLVMRAPVGSLLEQTNRLIVVRQRDYARTMGVPWGISESAYNARDLEFTYQYSNFGVPGLGLKRGLSENLVIAPYATGLATMVDAEAARKNFDLLESAGGLGRHGYYEALDYTKTRIPAGRRVAVVRNFMAHHQGMTIVAIANAVQDGRMRSRFHREPMIQACSLLLHERVPRDAAIAHPRAEEVGHAAVDAISRTSTVRRLDPTVGGPPATHLLSNGDYALMVTATGAGYSRWGSIAVTRWRADATRDDWGSFIMLHDAAAGASFGAAAKPIAGVADTDSAVFAEDSATFVRTHGPLTTTMEILMASDGDGEVRRLTIANAGRKLRTLDITSYAEIVLATAATDISHPAFAKLFVETEYLEEFGALIATRRSRSPDETPVWAAHFFVMEDGSVGPQSHETDRARFIGRGNGIGSATAWQTGGPLSNTVGTVLDPIFALRQRVSVAPGQSVQLAFWTMVAHSRDALLEIIENHHDRHAFERAQTLAWTQAQVQLRHFGISSSEAANFQQLAAPLLYPDARFRPAAATIERGAGPQSALWPLSISGDLPIVLLRIDDIEDMAQVRQLLRAQEYWRLKGLAVDLVIVNEHASSYLQDLHMAIEAAIGRSSARSSERAGAGQVHLLRADLMSLGARNLLLAMARVSLVARGGTLADQLDRILSSTRIEKPTLRLAAPTSRPSLAQATSLDLEFFNGTGGFDKNGREYVVVLDGGATTPAPWINVIANPGFGTQVSADGSSYCWAENSKENQLTPWSNDPVSDPPGDAIYVRDMESGAIFGPTALPVRDMGRYVARHGFGYSKFEHEADGVALDLVHFVPLTDPVRLSRLTLTNRSGRARTLSVTSYAELVLGTNRSASAPYIHTHIDAKTGALLARNPWNAAFPNRVAFCDLGGVQTSWTGDRAEFLGGDGSMKGPAALMAGTPLSGRVGPALDPCAALQTTIVLGVGETIEIVGAMGQCASLQDAQALVIKYRDIDLDTAMAEVSAHWDDVLGTVQVATPDRAMDIMLNGWLLYQALACRVWARAGFYQASGAYGFRDQLQDGMAICLARPDETRAHLLRAAARQFPQGDVQHWWLPHSGQGVRTRISDDRVWLSYAAATYASTTGDSKVFDEVLPFLEGPLLPDHEADSFFQPMTADEAASLFEHCARGLDQCIDLTGEHGLPLIGSGDWNDGMNRVGANGKGESVWLGWLLIRTIALIQPYAQARAPERLARWQAHAAKVLAAIEAHAWDGNWYRRATFDDGTWLGTADASECRIDSIAQSWAVLSQAADPQRAAQAMAALDTELVRRNPDLALLFTPPFSRSERDPGYIKGYPPGVRENGGQYSHAAMWAILAQAQLGHGDRAVELFSLLNPINHALDAEGAERYRVEPYVVAADVYSVAPYEGRGGWSWYTGAAGWMHRAGIEGILGLRRVGSVMTVSPVIPDHWPGFTATLRLGETRCSITVSRSANGETRLDGEIVAEAQVPIDGLAHRLEMSI